METLKKVGNKYFRSEYIWGLIFMIVLAKLNFLNEMIVLTLLAAVFGSKGLTDFRKTESAEKNKNIIYGISTNQIKQESASKDEVRKEFRNN